MMTYLLQFEEKVHRKDLTRAESIPLLMPRLLCYVLEQMGFPEEPTTDAASLDVLATAAAASDPPPPQQ